MNKNAYSTIDLSARRSAQMGIKMYQKLQAHFCCIFMGASDGSFFRWRKEGGGRGIQDSGDYGGDDPCPRFLPRYHAVF